MLDEPTNDLDLETLDLLQEVIADYEGTVLIVSHDRDFLDRTVTVTLGLDGSGKVDIVAGGYEDWVGSATGDRSFPGEGRGPGRAKPSLQPGLPACAGEQTHLQGPARSRPAAGGDRAAGGGNRRGRGGAARSRPVTSRDPERFAALTERIARHRAEKDAAEHRWLEVAGAMAGSRRVARALGYPLGRRLAARHLCSSLLDPPLEDGQRHRAVLQHLVELLDVELRRRASPCAFGARASQAMWPTL